MKRFIFERLYVYENTYTAVGSPCHPYKNIAISKSGG